MATITVPSVALPNSGDDMDSEQVRDWITNIRTFLEGTNIDEANVDLTGTDGVVGKSTAQTLTGLKSLENTSAAAGGVREVMQFGIDPATGTAADADGGRLVFYADDDTAGGGVETDIARFDWVLVDASNTTEDSRVDIYAMTTGSIGAVLELGYDASGNTVNVLQTTEVAAAAVRDVLILEWDPNDGTNLTASSSGIGLAFRMPDSGDSQDIMARIRAVGTDFTAASEDVRLDFMVITAGTLAAELQLDGANLAPTTNDGLAIGTATLGFADLFLATGGVINWNNGEVTITETDANTLTIAGTATLIDVAAGILELNDAVRFDTGVAMVAAAYAVGRDADATNQLHFNIPTGATFEWSVNDVAEMLLSITNLTPGANDGNALGSATVSWADLFLASGAVVNFNNGDVTLTHAANALTLGGGDLFVANNNGVVIGHSAQITAAEIDEFQVIGTASVDARALLGLWSAGSAGPALDFLKSKNGTIGSFTVVAADDSLGTIFWYGDDGFDYSTPAASIIGQVDGTPGSNDMPGRLVFSTTADGAASVTERLRITNGGLVIIGDGTTTSNAYSTIGLGVDQRANDDNVLWFESSDVVHALTSGGAGGQTTNTWFSARKYASTLGGAKLAAFQEDGDPNSYIVLTLEAYGGTADITKTTTGRGLVEVYASEHDGVNALTNITDNGNVFVIRSRLAGADATRFIIDEEGDIYAAQDVTAGLQTIDEFEDAHLIRAHTLALRDYGAAEGYVRSKWDEFILYKEDDLVKVGVLGAPLKDGGMWCLTQHMRLLNGAIWQGYERDMELAEALEEEQSKRMLLESRLAQIEERSRN